MVNVICNSSFVPQVFNKMLKDMEAHKKKPDLLAFEL